MATDEPDQLRAGHLRRPSHSRRALLFVDDQAGQPRRRHRVKVGPGRRGPQSPHVPKALPHLPSHAPSQVSRFCCCCWTGQTGAFWFASYCPSIHASFSTRRRAVSLHLSGRWLSIPLAINSLFLSLSLFVRFAR